MMASDMLDQGGIPSPQPEAAQHVREEHNIHNNSEASLQSLKRLISSTVYIELLDLICAIAKAQREVVALRDLSLSSFLAFFLREDTKRELRDGDIVAVTTSGKLANIEGNKIHWNEFVVVNDGAAKKLGYAMQSKGHWCITLGIAHISVEGNVAKGDVIRPNFDGNGNGSIVADFASSPFVGFVLESKANAKLSADGKRTVTIALSPNNDIFPSKSGKKDSQRIVNQPMRNMMTMIERLAYFFSPGNEGEPAPFEASGAQSQKSGLRFGLPVPARVGNPRFQSRMILDTDSSTSFDAVSYFEDIIGTAPPKGKVLAITGKAGSGKSTLLNAVIFRLHQKLNSYPIIWLDASNTSAICRSMIAFAKLLIQLGLISAIEPNKTQQVGAVQIIDSWLRKEKTWILVLDDVANPADLSSINIPFTNGTVLLSTRTSKAEICNFFETCVAVQIGPFRQEEAVDFVRRATGILDTDASTISKKLDFCPTTIALAVAHLCHKKCNVLQLLIELDTKKANLGALPMDIPFLREMLEIQIADLKNAQPDYCNMLFVLSFWNSKSIPVRMVDENRFPRNYYGISFLLHQTLLVAGQPGMISIHAMVQEVLRMQLKEWSQGDGKARTCCGLGSCSYKGLEMMSYTECLRCASKSVLAFMQLPDKEASQIAAPHAMKLVDYDCQDLQLMAITAQYLSEVQKDFKKSLALRQVVYKYQVDLLKNPNHDNVANTLCGIARVQEMMGQHQDAISTYEDVVRIWKRVKKDNLDIAKILDSIGLVFYKTDRFKGALLRFEESLSLKESIQDRDVKTEMIYTLEKIADSYHAQGYYDIALEKWKRVLELYRSMETPSHLDVARVLNTIGLIYADLQQYDEALQSYSEALDIMSKNSLENEVIAATTYTSMAKSYQCLGKYDQVLKQYERALAVQKRKCIGREKFAVSLTLDDLAYVHTILGDYVEAAACLEESLQIKKDLFDLENVHLAKAYFDLAVQQKNIGKRADAIESVSKAHEIYVRKLGAGDVKSLQASTLHADLLGLNSSVQSLSPNRSYDQYVLDVSKMIGNLSVAHSKSPNTRVLPGSPGPGSPEEGYSTGRSLAESSPRISASTPRTPRTTKATGTSRTPRKKKAVQEDNVVAESEPRLRNGLPPVSPSSPGSTITDTKGDSATPGTLQQSGHAATDDGAEPARHSARRPPSGNRYRKNPDRSLIVTPQSESQALEQIGISFENDSDVKDVTPHHLKIYGNEAADNTDMQGISSNLTPHETPPQSPSCLHPKSETDVRRSGQSSFQSSPAVDGQSPRVWSRSPRVLQKVPWPPSNASNPQQPDANIAGPGVRTPRCTVVTSPRPVSPKPTPISPLPMAEDTGTPLPMAEDAEKTTIGKGNPTWC